MHKGLDFPVNRCRPGHGASCAACCGSHNFTMPFEDIERLLLARGRGEQTGPAVHPEDSTEEKLFDEEMQCPHMGILPPHYDRVGCLAYDDEFTDEDIASFFSGTCRNFYCAAWYELTDEQVLFAAGLMGDWYYYSLFIKDMESVREMHAGYGVPENVPLAVLRSLKEDLEERFLEEDGG